MKYIKEYNHRLSHDPSILIELEDYLLEIFDKYHATKIDAGTVYNLSDVDKAEMGIFYYSDKDNIYIGYGYKKIICGDIYH